MRRPDETVCFTCNGVIPRDASPCPQCGAAVATGPKMAQPATFGVPGTVPQASGVSAYPAAERDVVGAGRYILYFALAGLIGLVLTYLLREHGWLATWISIPIFVIVVAIVSSGEFS